jgi:RecA-family ATPase
MGIPLWGYPVRKGTVLYLALEDAYRRLQERLYRMFGTDSTENLHFAISAKQLGGGLDEQLERFMQEYPDTNLIIIDTLQKVREIGGDNYSYANDYEIIMRLKQFADRYGLCLLLVHHTRKQQADDKFDMISGTNGLLGAADGAFLLQKEKRTNNNATLDISGRDQQDQRLFLKRDPEKLIWLLENAELELWKEPPDPILDTVAAVVTKANPQNRPRYETSRSHAGRSIKLWLEISQT